MVYDEFEEVKGRLIALVVVFPDFAVRVNESIELYEQGLTNPNQKLLAYIGSDMASLLKYFREVYQNVEETREQLSPIIFLLEGLTEPA